MKCDFKISPVGGFRCSVCGFDSDVVIDRECPGASMQAVGNATLGKRRCCGQGKYRMVTGEDIRRQKDRQG